MNSTATSPTASPDDPAPRRSSLTFPVVGVGASAGGLGALLQLFEHLPDQTGMAFVVVLHLSPEHESNAPAILQRVTRMPVQQVTDDIDIQADHVYVIAPALQLTMDDGHLRVQAAARPPGRHVAIDLFFRTLARAHGERAVAVVLSGTGSDGSVGLADMKAEGGVVFAQSPQEAEYEGMPNAAIATQLVDFVLPAAEIAARLVALWHNAQRIELPDAQHLGAKAEEPQGPRAIAQAESAVRDVMALLHATTGNDFRHYKRAIVLRRLERRMQVTGQPTLPAYRDYLERHPDEIHPLLQDMLISVTSFFRDREAYEALERDIAKSLFGRPNMPRQVRAWVVGCATGEEAYSMAMLINDHVPTLQSMAVQVFASDIDERALGVARHGVYPEAIATDVPPTRLRSYFQQEVGSYRIRKALREQVMFARHNVLRDPPFSRVDIISCRNLLIYLERDVQAQVLEVFHFALNPGGLLFLGTAESADWLPGLFEPVDKKQRVYRALSPGRPRRELPSLRMDALPALVRPHAPPAVVPLAAPIGQVHERLLGEELPPSVLIDAARNVVHIGGGASRWLRQSEGVPARDLLDMLQPALADVLGPALMHAVHSGERVAAPPVRIEGDAGATVLQMSVRPALRQDKTSLLVVLFDELDVHLGLESAAGAPDRVQDILQEELRRLKEQLQGTLGDSASSSEALRASNEELQSINEELRSATEELETSKEELQSVNEELSTVNFELKAKVDEAGKVNDDLTNLIISMDIATVFVDRAMQIKRFTPRAAEVFNVRGADVGRPLLDLAYRLRYDTLGDDVAQVLSRLQTQEREVEGQEGRWFLVRISPYRMGEDRVDGAVLNFIDVTERRKAEDELRAREKRLRLVAENTRDYAIMTMDAHGRVTSWNKGAELLFGYAEAEMLGESFDRVFVPEDRAAGAPQQELRNARENGRALDERWHQRKDGSRFYCSGITTPFGEPGGEGFGFAKIARDLTERQLLEKQREELLHAEQRVRHQLEAAHAMRSEFLAIMSHELKNPLNLILLNAELISRAAEVRGAPPLLRAADTIRRTVHSQSQIIDDLLDLSRLNNGKLSLNRAAVEYGPVVERITGAVEAEARARNIALVVTLADVVVYADAVRLEQIVWNLVSNALKFTPSGGRIEVRLSRDGPSARLDVQDTGRGIRPTDLDRIFDMFEQGDGRSTTRRDGGLGIGLALVKHLGELHGGRVAATSAGMGHGATFSVWLPLFDGLSGGDSPAAGQTLQDCRVLLVEDDADTLEAMCMLLESEGAVVTTAARAQQALQLAETHTFDLVISDIAMPGMDGLALVEELRRRPRSAGWPVIAVTGFGRPADADRARAAGFDAHLPKPLSLEALHQAFNAVRSAR